MKISIPIILIIVIFTIVAEVSYFEQNEMAFEYNVISGKPVSVEENPLLGFGLHMALGWNAKIFRVSSEANNYNFTNDKDDYSPYNEALSFDSKEGTTMDLDYTIMAHVENPYLFYDNFGTSQYDYSEIDGITDSRIYEGIRAIGSFVDIRIGELAEKKNAISIQRNPTEILSQVKDEANEYALTLGLALDDLLTSSSVEFPDGNTIDEARKLLGDVNGEYEAKLTEEGKAEEAKNSVIALANIEADKIISEANIEANNLTQEAQAIANNLKEAIAQVGVDAAFNQLMAEYTAQLIKAGVLPEVFLNEKSLLGATFYKSKQ